MFSSLTENGDIWSLPVDANLGKVTGQPQRVTKEQGAEYYPSVSLDGKTLAFVSHRDGNPDIWTKDLESGKETSTVGTPTVELHPAVSADGFRVAYLSLSQTQGGAIIGVIRVIPVTGGISKELCSSCSGPLDWSSDERRMVFNELHGNQLVSYLMEPQRNPTFLITPVRKSTSRLTVIGLPLLSSQFQVSRHPLAAVFSSLPTSQSLFEKSSGFL